MSGADHAGALELKFRAMLAGLRREFPPSTESVRFGGRSMSSGEMVALIQSTLDTFEAVHQAEGAFRQAVVNRRRAMKGSRSIYEDAVFFLKHQLGKNSPRLAQFGVALPKDRRPPTAEAAAISRAKAAATRKARGTLGKRQRLALGRPPEPVLQVLGADRQPLRVAGEGAVDAAGQVSEGPEPSGTD